MEALTLTEQEQRYYAELFSSCDVDNTGKVSGVQVSELFLASQLPAETLHQITELCGAKRLGHFGRSQFYIALKLIAATQCGLPVKFESLNSGIEIPVPKFNIRLNEQDKKTLQIVSGYPQPVGDQEIIPIDRPNQIVAVSIPPPPSTKGHVRTLSNQRSGISYVEVETTQSAPIVNQMTSVSGSGNGSPLDGGSPKLSTPSSSPVNNPPLNKEQGWASFDKGKTEEQIKTWSQFQGRRHSAQEINNEHSSEEDDDDIWIITDEQKDYYINQFKTMQQDLTGLISGAIAKEFFEKSKLPIIELSKIWQLSDINKDGALSLEEFCTAMHLVVLRRNDIELPDALPTSLMPRLLEKQCDENLINSAAPESSSPSKLTPLDTNSPPNKEWTKFNESPTSSCKSSPGMKPVNFDFTAVTSDPDSKIIHPVAVRMSPDGPHFIPTDETDISNISDTSAAGDAVSTGQISRQRSLTDSAVEASSVRLAPPPHAKHRPGSKKGLSLAGAPGFPPHQTISNQLSGSSDSEGQNKQIHLSSFPVTTAKHKGNSSAAAAPALPQGPKKDAPPPPPPRVKKYHARSSSLDLNKVLDKSGLQQLGAPPAVPPGVSPSATTARKLLSQKSESGIANDQEPTNFADFNQFSTDTTQTSEADVTSGDGASCVGVSQHRISQHRRSGSLDQFMCLQAVGAFEVYKKPANQTEPVLTSPSAMPMLTPDKDTTSPQPNKTRVLEDNAQIGDINRNESELSQDIVENTEIPHTRSKDKRDIQTAIRSHKERNTMLSRLNSELNQELAEVMEERIALEIQLEHLKPFSS